MAAAKMFLLSMIFISLSFSQNFDLLSAKSVDKIAESKFFNIDSNKILNAYEIYSFNTPIARIQDSLFIVAGVRSAVSGSKKSGAVPVNGFSLDQNYPNPFNPSTTIRFTVGKSAKVSVVLFDMSGREVATLINDVKGSGNYKVRWNGRTNDGATAASGTYLYRMLASFDDGTTSVETRKLTLLK